jgi:hypothetical protein
MIQRAVSCLTARMAYVAFYIQGRDRLFHGNCNRLYLKIKTIFARSNAWIVGSNPTQNINVCVCLFYVCVVLSVDSGLATGLITRPRSPTVCAKMITKLQKRPCTNKGL